MVLSTSNGPSSLNSRHLVRVCSQHTCGALLSPGLPESDVCDRCLSRMRAHNTSTNPRDTTRAYASRVESTFTNSNGPKEAISVAPAVPLSVTYSVASLQRYPPLSPYLLPSSQLESTYNFETEISNKRLGRNSTPVSYRGRPVNLPGSTTSVPLYNYYGSVHESFQPNISHLTGEKNRRQPQEPHLCEVCQTVLPSCYSDAICPNRHFFDAPFKEIDCFSKPKEIVPESNVEDDLSTAVMSIFSSSDKILDDADDIDIEGIELSYPEVIDSGFTEEPQPAQESSSRVKGKLHSENVAQHSNPVVLDLAATFPEPKKTPRSTLRSLKLCSTMGCTSVISSASPASRCLGCVRRDWRSKIRGHSVDDGRPNSGIIKRSIPTKQKTKKVVTWADEEASRVSTSQKTDKMLECDPTTEQQQHNMPSIDSSSEHGISPGSSTDLPLAIDEGPQVCLNIQVNKLPSAAETRTPSKRSESPKIGLNDPTTGSNGPHADLLAPAFNDDLCLGAQVDSATSIEPNASPGMLQSTEVSIFDWDSDLSNLSDDNESEEEVSSSNSLEASPLFAPTGLKIRIPPRPGLYVRKCGSIQCQQRLPATYRWKSCVMCRAQIRGHQRIRQSIQGRSQIVGTPLSRNIIDDNPPVAGARLCSVHSCTYIIPPSSEYRWKMCALCRIRAKSNQALEDASKSPRQDETISQTFNSTTKIAERLPKRDKHLPGRCKSLDCGILLSGTESTPDCGQCIARNSWLMNGGISKQTLLGRTGKVHPAHPSKSWVPSPYPQYKALPTLLADLRVRLNDFLQVQSVFSLHNTAESRFNSTKAIFVFDAEYSIVALDFDIIGRKEAVDDNVLKLKAELERIGQIQFSPNRYISILEGGGIAERYICPEQAPILQAVSNGQDASAATYIKNMYGELEIAVVPDHSHPFLPGQRTIVRFRLLG